MESDYSAQGANSGDRTPEAFDPYGLEAGVLAERRNRLAGKTAIVTGAAGGVGGGIARRLATAGVRVIAADRDEAGARRAADSLAGMGVPWRVDVTREDEVEQMVEGVAARYGRVDLYCNNAGIVSVTPFMDVPLDEWRGVLDVNLNGVFIGTRAAARQMRRQEVDAAIGCRGKIVNTSSPAAEARAGASDGGGGRRGAANLAVAYGASKAGVNYLTRATAAVLSGDSISVSALYPGNVWEGMQKDLDGARGAVQGLAAGESARRKLDTWPTGRWQRPDDTGDMVVFIASYRGMGLTGRVVISHPFFRDL